VRQAGKIVRIAGKAARAVGKEEKKKMKIKERSTAKHKEI